ncbi:MAG TPA: hypothetical protein VFZ61_10115 [Polyangiales bacterium]
MRANGLESGGQWRGPADESPYYGAREGSERGLGSRATHAAFDSMRYATDHALSSISEGVSDVGNRTKRAAHGFADFVGTHAIPLGLLGAGLGWLLVDMSNKRRAASPFPLSAAAEPKEPGVVRQRSVELATRASEALHEGRDKVVDRAHEVGAQVTNRVKEMSHQVKEMSHQVVEGASHLGDQAASYGRKAYGAVGRAGTRAMKLSGDNPLVTGLVALMLGATAGLLLPATRRENRLLGGSRDRLLHAAQQSATQLKETAQHGVEELKSAIAPQLQPST